MIVALLVSAALADGPHAIDVRWSPAVRARQDDLMSPLVHAGVSPIGGAFGYRWRGPRAAVATGIEFDVVPARSGPSFTFPGDGEERRTYPSSWLTVRLPTGWGVDVLADEALDLVVGGLLDVRIEMLSWSYGVTWTTGYSGAFTLGPWLDLRWRPVARWSLQGSVTAPLAGWVARSPYALNDDEYMLANRTHDPFVTFGALVADGRPKWFGSYPAVRLQVGAAYAVTPVTALVAGYRFDVFHDPAPRPVTAVGHVLDLGVRVTF